MRKIIEFVYSDSFIYEFCKVEFLCYNYFPNWLGAGLLVFGPPLIFFIWLMWYGKF